MVKGVRMQCNRFTPASCWLVGPGQGTAIKANHVAPQIRSVFPCTAQEKSPTMKFVVSFSSVANELLVVSPGLVHTLCVHLILKFTIILVPLFMHLFEFRLFEVNGTQSSWKCRVNIFFFFFFFVIADCPFRRYGCCQCLPWILTRTGK